MTQLPTIEELEARLEGSCDGEALLALADRRSDPRAIEAIRRHLERCPDCREQGFWNAALERLLGPVHEQHPASAALTAFAAGELPAEARARIALHLASCESCALLRRAAEAGLEEAERVLGGLALAEALAAGQSEEGIELHLPLLLPRPPAPRAFAAEAAIEPAAPLPEDRRVLLEGEGFRVVYYRLGAQAEVALFGDSLARIALELALDGERLLPSLREPEAIRFSLGPAQELVGRSLSLELGDGDRRLRRSFILVESGA